MSALPPSLIETLLNSLSADYSPSALLTEVALGGLWYDMKLGLQWRENTINYGLETLYNIRGEDKLWQKGPSQWNIWYVLIHQTTALIKDQLSGPKVTISSDAISLTRWLHLLWVKEKGLEAAITEAASMVSWAATHGNMVDPLRGAGDWANCELLDVEVSWVELHWRDLLLTTGLEGEHICERQDWDSYEELLLQ